MNDEHIRPLHEDDFVQIKEGLDNLASAEQEIAKAKRAGIEVGDRETQVKELRAKLTQVRNVYFPGRT